MVGRFVIGPSKFFIISFLVFSIKKAYRITAAAGTSLASLVQGLPVHDYSYWPEFTTVVHILSLNLYMFNFF
jgi:hypothetical protein